MNETLQKISKRGVEDLPAFIAESEEEILAAIHTATKEAELSEKHAKLRLSFSIVVDLDGDKITTKLAFGSRTTRSRDGSLSEESQLEIKGDDQA